MQTFLAKYKIKGKLNEVYEWARYLNEHKEEALETLRNEGVAFEFAAVDHQIDGPYLIYMFKARDIKEVFDVLEKSQLPVDLYHKKVLPRILERHVLLKPVIDFENLNPQERKYEKL